MWLNQINKLCYFRCKVSCRIKGDLKKQITLEQKGIIIVLLAMFFFNDPVFMLHIYNPTMVTFFISELFTASFICALMIFWLVEAARGGR